MKSVAPGKAAHKPSRSRCAPREGDRDTSIEPSEAHAKEASWSKVPHGLLSDTRLSERARLLASALLFWSLQQGRAVTASNGTIAEFLGVSKSKVRRALDELVCYGYVERTEFPATRKNQSGRILRLLWLRDPKIIPAPPSRDRNDSLHEAGTDRVTFEPVRRGPERQCAGGLSASAQPPGAPVRNKEDRCRKKAEESLKKPETERISDSSNDNDSGPRAIPNATATGPAPAQDISESAPPSPAPAVASHRTTGDEELRKFLAHRARAGGQADIPAAAEHPRPAAVAAPREPARSARPAAPPADLARQSPGELEFRARLEVEGLLPIWEALSGSKRMMLLEPHAHGFDATAFDIAKAELRSARKLDAPPPEEATALELVHRLPGDRRLVPQAVRTMLNELGDKEGSQGYWDRLCHEIAAGLRPPESLAEPLQRVRHAIEKGGDSAPKNRGAYLVKAVQSWDRDHQGRSHP